MPAAPPPDNHFDSPKWQVEVVVDDDEVRGGLRTLHEGAYRLAGGIHHRFWQHERRTLPLKRALGDERKRLFVRSEHIKATPLCKKLDCRPAGIVPGPIILLPWVPEPHYDERHARILTE